MLNQDQRIPLAEKIAAEWNKNSIRYSIVHGLENYPERLGRDLDIIVNPTDAKEAMRIAINVAHGKDYEEHILRWSHWGLYQLALINRKRKISLPLDLMCTTRVWQAKFINMFRENEIAELTNGDSQIGPFAYSIEGTFFKACVRALICGDLHRFGYELEMPIQIPKQVNKKLLTDILGDYGISLLASKSPKDLSRHFPGAMYKIQRNWLIRHPMRLLAGLVKVISRRIGLLLFTTSDVLVIRSKGSNKTLEALVELMPIFKKLFIEIKPVIFNGCKMKQYYGNIITWREKPVSEFKVNIVIQDDTIEHKIDTARLLPRSGRFFLSPDGVVQLPHGLSLSGEKKELYNVILDYMTKKYCYSVFWGPWK